MLGVLAACWSLGSASFAAAAAPPDSTVPAVPGPLVAVPEGCTAPAAATAVFTGTLTAFDDPDRPTTARFAVTRTLAGQLGTYLVGGLVDVRYGTEARFLEPDVQYVVGVRPDPESGVLISTVSEAAPLFGGDAVIGFYDSDTDCPRVEDPVRTLFADGTSVETGVLSPLQGQGRTLLWAVVRPLLWGLLALVLLVGLKHLVVAGGRSLRDMARTPAPPVRSPQRPAAGRVRR